MTPPTPHRPLAESDLLPHGPWPRVGSSVLLFQTIDSTNTALLRGAADLPDGTVACTEYQTAGRGRFNRRWEAPRGGSILLSVLLIEPPDSPILRLAALLGALAACDAIEQHTTSEPAVRWPNDIVINTRKVGGVLAESCPRDRDRALVIGVGLNCLQHRGHFSPDLVPRATSLELESDNPVDRASIAAALLEHLSNWLTLGAEDTGPTILRQTWRDRCCDVGTRVTLQHDGRTFAGTALDIADSGDLIVELDHGRRQHFAAATTTRLS